MKNFKLYSILFILSFFLFSCEDDGENVKEKDKFSTINDKTYWLDVDNEGDVTGYEGWYFEKDNLYMYAQETYGGETDDWCMRIPLKDGQYKDSEGYDYLLNVLVNKEDTLTLQFAEVPGSTQDPYYMYFEAGEIDFITRGNILKVTMHYLESNGTFDTEEWGSYTKTDKDQKPATTCTGG